MIRAVGYCDNGECKSVHKGVFLLDYGSTFFCPQCEQEGWIEEEKKIFHGLIGPKEDALYREVIFHFDFAPVFRGYNARAVVSIPDLREGVVLEVASPLVRTERRALKIAEYTLCAANSGRISSNGISTELLIDLCHPDWRKQIEHVEKVLDERDRRISYAIRHSA